MNRLFFLALFCFATSNIYAQNFNYGTIQNDEYHFDKNKIDSNANAVVLREFGTAAMQIDDATGRLVIQFEHHVKIKIYNKEGFKFANIVIPTYKDDNKQEFVNDLKASTFNMVNGEFVETLMDKKAVFTENRNKYTQLTKFTLPNIKDGSVIEYSYRIESPLIFNFRTWEFQGDIPKVSSEFVANIPGNYNYNVSLRGYQKLTDSKAEIYKECLRLNGVSIDCSRMTYIMKNVPAFIEEDYMTAASNFKSAMYFELSDVQLTNGSKQSYTKTWNDVDYELTSDKNFGSQMKKAAVFKDLMPAILKGETDNLAKANAVYNYIKKQIKWNNYYGNYSMENTKTILENRSGNIADINLTLISALSAAGLETEAVILSTRENGMPNKLFPVLSSFNYVVAKVNIADKSYLLDATEPLLPFGLLPIRCINDQGRVINLKKPSYWIDLKASQKSVTTYLLTGKLNADGKINGVITTTSIGYAAFNKRKDIKKYNSAEEFVEKLDERLTKMSLANPEINNIDSVEKPLIEKYEIEFSAHDGTDKNQLFINPFFINRITKNPFNLNDRMFPVDLGSASDERIIISVSLPEKYELIEKPKDMAISLPASGGRYLLQSSMEDGKLSVSQILQFNKAIYNADDYLYLKEFYSKIIQNQKNDVLLKKAN
jgi:transglutaminase-like putative cysteine protease